MLAVILLCCAALGPANDLDTDGDGLSDFHERHKYFTNPEKADSDGDRVPDGDWDERREYAYTIRALFQVLPPVTPDVLSDDYQDARVLDRPDDYVELEVILYPLNTVAEALTADENWRAAAASMPEWTRPGPTANWDAELAEQITALLKSDGVDPAVMDDRALVAAAAKRLLEHAKYVDGFSTFCSAFIDGKMQVYPGMEEAARQGQAEKSLTLEEQWQRELYAKGMFENATRGSCTSSAIYLNGCLKALGIPTRIVLTTPIIDSSDEREHALVKRLRHHQVRRTIERGTGHLGNSWSSHTYNEVFVGGRWRRLNYDRLGQNILDPQFFGLMVHVATFADWADGNMAATWGMRDANGNPFGGSNPYHCLALSDRFGAHATIDNPPLPELKQLTIDQAWWFDECPAAPGMRLDDPETAGHVIVHVEESRADEGVEQYATFYDKVGKEFVLRADGHPDVRIHATRGYWVSPKQGLQHFYLRIEPDDLKTMQVGAPYTLHVKDDAREYRWAVRAGVTLTRAAEAKKEKSAVAQAQTAPAETTSPAEPDAAGVPTVVTIDYVVWTDAPNSPTGQLPDMKPVLLARVGKAEDFDQIKAFTERCDQRFFLEAEGHPTLRVGCGVGGLTTNEHSFLMIELGPGDWRDHAEGVEYTLRPQNSNAKYRWKVAGPLRAKR